MRYHSLIGWLYMHVAYIYKTEVEQFHTIAMLLGAMWMGLWYTLPSVVRLALRSGKAAIPNIWS